MAFMVQPDGADGSGENGERGPRRPDCRAGAKVLAFCGMMYGKSAAGNDKIDACWVVIDDPDGGQDVGALVFDTFTLTERAVWKLQQVSGALGQQSSWDVEDQKATWEVFAQAPVKATIKIEPKYSGDGTRPSVDRYSRSAFKITKEVDELIANTEKWYSDWKKKKQQQSGGGGRTSRASTFDSDDIPF